MDIVLLSGIIVFDTIVSIPLATHAYGIETMVSKTMIPESKTMSKWLLPTSERRFNKLAS